MVIDMSGLNMGWQNIRDLTLFPRVFEIVKAAIGKGSVFTLRAFHDLPVVKQHLLEDKPVPEVIELPA